MVQSNRTLKEFIKLIVESKTRSAHLRDGAVVEWGDPKHISDLEEQIASIQERKKRYGRGTAVRAEWAKVESRLRAELKSARKRANQNLLSEED